MLKLRIVDTKPCNLQNGFVLLTSSSFCCLFFFVAKGLRETCMTCLDTFPFLVWFDFLFAVQFIYMYKVRIYLKKVNKSHQATFMIIQLIDILFQVEFFHKDSLLLSLIHLPINCWRKATPQQYIATHMFHCGDFVLRVIWSGGFPPHTDFCMKAQKFSALCCLLQNSCTYVDIRSHKDVIILLIS